MEAHVPKVAARYVDLPQNFQDEVGGEFYRSDLQELRHWLAEIVGREITDEDIRASIKVYNQNRALIRELYALRGGGTRKVRSTEVYLLLRAGLVLPVEEHNELVRAYLGAARDQDRPLKTIPAW